MNAGSRCATGRMPLSGSAKISSHPVVAASARCSQSHRRSCRAARPDGPGGRPVKSSGSPKSRCAGRVGRRLPARRCFCGRRPPRCQPLVQVWVQWVQAIRGPMAGLQVSDVLAVGVMCLIEGLVPDNSQPQRGQRIQRHQPPKQPELQVITQITGISILHTPTIADQAGNLWVRAKNDPARRAATRAGTHSRRHAATWSPSGHRCRVRGTYVPHG